VAILNDDDAQVRRMAHGTPARAVTYGRRPGASVRAQRITGDPLLGRRFTLTYEGEHARVRLNVPGEHAITTALAAASVALTCGMSLSLVATCLGAIHPVKRRGEVKRGVLGVTLVDDTYNANRQSAVAAISLLKGASVPKDARRWFVFGDMLELGAYSHDEHAAVGTAAAGAVDELVLVGADVHATADAARRAGMPAERIHHFPAPIDNAATLAQARGDAAGFLRGHLRAGDVVLVKGSLGVGMDAVVTALLEGCDDNHAS
jgi:UDP-N-acetylmuramoyl-tripeptide--D-alanyl-D-alanine ligase